MVLKSQDGGICMPIIVIFILMSLAFYVLYKIQYVRSKKPIEKKWLSAKSLIALGFFVALFGVNRLFIDISALSLTISIVFIVIGGLSLYTGIRAYRYYLPHVEKEFQEWQKAER